MWIVLCLELTFGLLASSWASSIQEVKIRSCSYLGVFYVQGNDRHSLTFTEAQTLCEGLNATLASAEQIIAAHGTGLEFCRYGWISDGNVGIVRQTSNPNCRSGQTGPIIFKPTDNHHDALCYEEADISEKNCTFAINLGFVTDPPLPPNNTDTEVTTIPLTGVDTEGPTTKPALDNTELDDTYEATTSHEENEEVGAQTTQSSIVENTEPAGDTEIPTTESKTQTETHTQKTVMDNITGSPALMPGLESTGSGMGEPPVHTIEPTRYTQHTNVDHAHTKETTTETDNEDTAVSQETNVKGKIMLPPTEDKSNSGSSDWLIIVGLIVAVAAILLVCAAVATRKRWCGKRQTLMITSKSNSEGNGTAASASSSRAQEREQEMVTLMNKEKIQENGNTEEFTVITLEESPEKNQQA